MRHCTWCSRQQRNSCMQEKIQTMFTIIFILAIILHGLLHGLGFAKAFDGNITQLSRAISKPMGVLWLTAALLFIATAVLFFFNLSSWHITAILAVLLSQVLIISVWADAKFGSIINAGILLTMFWCMQRGGL